MPRYSLQVTPRDIRILRFLWKWKLASNSALSQRFFGGGALITAFNRMRKLRLLGLVRQITLTLNHGNAWTLTRKGFLLINEQLPELLKKGFKPATPDHDLLVMAFHLGEWLLEYPKETYLVSEQQLNSLSPELLPSWIPKVSLHRPDGYTHLTNRQGDSSLIALEMEISRKAKHRYDKIRDFYYHMKTISDTVWVTDSLTEAKRIQGLMDEVHRKSSSDHHFILLEDFKHSGWNARIRLGPFEGLPYSSFLSEKGQDFPMIPSKKVLTQELLNLRFTSAKTKF